MSRFVLDCAVSRPVSDRVAGWYTSAARQGWASPNAGYHEGKQASMLLDQSSASLARLVQGQQVWFCPDIGTAVTDAVTPLVTTAEAVATTAVDTVQVQQATRRAAATAAVAHHVLAVGPDGRVDEAALRHLPTPAVLVTNLANQEIGVVQRTLGDWADTTGSSLVLDASVAFGWLDLPGRWSRLLLDPRAWGGVPGAVAVCATTASGRRTTDNVAAAAVAALSAEQWILQAPGARARARRQIIALREQVEHGVRGVEIRGGGHGDLPHILSISVLHVDAEALQTRLDALGYAVGSGSACASRQGQPSHVLAAVGGLTGGNLRVGLPPDLPDEVVRGFGEAVISVVHEVREQMGTQDL